jgi:hypothetical protein
MSIAAVNLEVLNRHILTDEQVKELRQSEVWPVLMALHYNSDRQLTCVHSVKANNNSTCLWTITMGTASGLNIVAVRILKHTHPTDYYVTLCSHHLRLGHLESNSIIKSNKVNYLVKCIADKKHNAMGAIKEMIRRSERVLPNVLESIMNKMYNSTNEMRLDSMPMEMNKTAQKYALQVAVHGLPFNNVPMSIQNEMRSKLDEYSARENQLNRRLEYAEEFSRGEKWLAGIWGNRIIVGALSAGLLLEPLSSVARNNSVTKYDLKTSVPFRMFAADKQEQLLQEEWGSEFMAALTMLSLHTQSKDRTQTVMPIFPIEHFKFLHDLNAAVWANYDLQWVIMEKN